MAASSRPTITPDCEFEQKKIDSKKHLVKVLSYDCSENLNELRVMKLLSGTHPNILKLEKVENRDDALVLICEYKPNTLLRVVQQRGGLNFKKTIRVFRQLVGVLLHIHQVGYIHKDLKLENIFYHKGFVYLSGFSLSRPFGEYLLQDHEGSLNYAAPELIHGKQYYGPEVDVWALGVVMFMTWSGYFPYHSTSIAELTDQMAGLDITHFPRKCKNKKLKELILSMLVYDRTKRASLDTINTNLLLFN